jgi:hypothetical protein
MAELSKDTQAILGSLKAEQAAVQENNEIQRDVGAKLERFGGMFSAIKDSMTDTQNSLSRQTALANDAAERSKQQAAFAKVNDGNEKSTVKQLSDIMGDGFAGIKSGFAGIKSGFASLKSGVATGAGLLQKLAFGAAGLFVGYNLVKGFLDETTNGGFSRMEESIRNIDWAAVKSSASTFSSALLNVSTYLDNFPSVLLGLVGVGITNAFVRGTATGVAGTLMQSLLTRPGGPGGAPGPRRGLSPAIRRLGIGGIIAGGIATLTYMYGDEAANWINDQMGTGPDSPSGVDWGKKTVSGVSIIAQATSLGMMFGPPGAIAMAALSTAYVLGREIYDWMQRTKDAAAAKLREDLDKVESVLGAGENASEIKAEIEAAAEELTEGPAGDRAREALQQRLMDNFGLSNTQAGLLLADDRIQPTDDTAWWLNEIATLKETVDSERMQNTSPGVNAPSFSLLARTQREFNEWLVEQGRASEQIQIEISKFDRLEAQRRAREDALERAAQGYSAPMVFNFSPTSVVDQSQKIVHGGNKGYIETNTFGAQPHYAGQNRKSYGIAQ